jgi:CubicO group peptidase (beta-lactamase class C family)
MSTRGSTRRVTLLAGAAAVVVMSTFGVALALEVAPVSWASTGGKPTSHPVPGPSWENVSPASAGFDPAMLDRIAARAKKGQSNCLVVARDGKLVGEWYFRGTEPNTTQNVFSVTKSFTSTLVGIASDDGDLRVGDKASTWISAWKGTPSDAVTIRDLLSMDSGRQWSFLTDYVQLVAAADQTAFAIGLGQSQPPGKRWTYNNAAVQTLEQVLEKATGKDVAAFAAKRLFEPLGMTHTTMTTDAAGNAQTFAGIMSTCRDLARFGVLMLDKGRWGAKQIVSSGWVEQATGRSSTALNAAYGYLWWLNRKGTLAGRASATNLGAARNQTTKPGQLVPGAPADMVWALGLGNQLIQIDPSSRTVVVRLGTAEAIPSPPTFGPAEASKVLTAALRK